MENQKPFIILQFWKVKWVLGGGACLKSKASPAVSRESPFLGLFQHAEMHSLACGSPCPSSKPATASSKLFSKDIDGYFRLAQIMIQDGYLILRFFLVSAEPPLRAKAAFPGTGDYDLVP